MSLKKCNSMLTCLNCDYQFSYNKEKNSCNLIKQLAWSYQSINRVALSLSHYAYAKTIVEQNIFNNLQYMSSRYRYVK